MKTYSIQNENSASNLNQTITVNGLSNALKICKALSSTGSCLLTDTETGTIWAVLGGKRWFQYVYKNVESID